MKTVYFHIGYPKAASTFLQKSVFKNQKKIYFLNEYHWDDLLKFSKFLFWSKKDEFENNINHYLKFFDELDSNKVNVISHEGYSNFSSNPNFKIDEIFLRLKKVSEIKKIKFKFIFVIRRQGEYIKSRYAQGHGFTGFYSVNNSYEKFSELRNFFYKKDRSKSEINAFETFNYFKTYSDLKKIFRDEPKILVYEDLNHSPKNFIIPLIDFIGIKDGFSYENLNFDVFNVGKKDPQTGEYFRKKNIYHKPYDGILNILTKAVPFKNFFLRLFSRKIKDKIKILSYKFDRILHGHDKIVLSENDKLKIQQYYSSSNKKLSKIISRNLEDLGY